MLISSTRNPAVQYVRSLARSKAQVQERVFLAEGIRLVEEALATGQSCSLVLYEPEALARSSRGVALEGQMVQWAERLVPVTNRVLSSVAQTDSPPGLIAVLRRPPPPPLDDKAWSFAILLDRLSDPGNVGSIIRSAAALGAGCVMALPGTVDLYAPKVVRSGMGAHFRIALHDQFDLNELDALSTSAKLVALDARAALSVEDYPWMTRTVLVVGKEAEGLSPEVLARVRETVRIPMGRQVESLNAGVAAAIAMYSAQLVTRRHRE